MAVVTKELLEGLVERLRSAEPGLREHDTEAADAVAGGADELERRIEGGDVDGAGESAFELWKSLLEFPVIRGLFPTMAPSEDADAQSRDPELVQAAVAIGYFQNEVIREIGRLPR